ncbi:hypothetical protein L227DRAFT_600622 [Lentinus tigrinus ALCF2SS1-6]|uniref:Rap-GAP domain-containing protein n=1 Tax=Lentinus tigrinus ALCF2SS1-6 TaxID=1328759 RepID=A0A5C2SCA2_9APHY|nr:hypothetical protein L227DRAFT_600622 [Lentinus tigrinus ALCF2SS1-6]
MPSQNDDVHRPSRQRANTSAFPFAWRRGRAENVPTPAPPAVSPPLQFEALIEALTSQAVPSLTVARSLAAALGTVGTHSPPPRLSTLHPILFKLCSPESPPPLQTAGYDILTAFLEANGPSMVSTADRLSCLSLFVDAPWSQELWESRSRALAALTDSGSQTLGMETQILRMLESWIERAFDGLAHTRPDTSHEERLERQRSVESLTSLLINLVRKPEFVSRLTEDDTAGVLHLWERLLDRALSMSGDFALSPPSSPLIEPQSSKAVSPQKLSSHRRHHSSTSVPKLSLVKHPADIMVDAYLTYLSERLVALAPTYLTSILPLLFRSLAFYSTPLPRISLQAITPPPHQHSLEQRISDLLGKLVAGPYASQCKILLKRHFFPCSQDLHVSIQTSRGALRTLRMSLRRVLEGRLARGYIARVSSNEYSPAGVPTQLALERGLMERAWAKDEGAGWDLIRFANVLARAARKWISQEHETSPLEVAAPREDVLNEIASIVKDNIQAMDERGEGEDVDDEEVEAIGRITRELVVYIRSLKTPDGGLVPISLNRPEGSSPFLSAIANILAQDLRTTPLFPVLPAIILSVADHLPDRDLSQLLVNMADRQLLSPTSLSWLDDWSAILTMPNLFSPNRYTARQHAMGHLESVWEFVKDIPAYRKPLANLVFDVWKHHSIDELEDQTALVAWNLLADEAVLRLVEKHADDPSTEECEANETFCEEILEFLLSVAHEQRQDDDDDAASILTVESAAISPPLIISPANTAAASPILSRMTSEYPIPPQKEALPSVMSLLSSLTSGMPSRSQSKPRRSTNDMLPPVETPSPVLAAVDIPSTSTNPRSVGAVIALVSVFSQLVFTPLAQSRCSLWHARRVFQHLVDLISSAGCVRARLTTLQFLMRLRVDRDHRLYFAKDEYDKDGHIASLAALIGRAEAGPNTVEDFMRDEDIRRARPRVPQERDGRRPSRGRGGPRMDASRSRSRVPTRVLSLPVIKLRPREQMWSMPEVLLFSVSASDVSSEGMTSYDPACPGPSESVLQSSLYLSKIVDIIETEKEWEILSYVLCHLPAQLANKHLFCGPRSKLVVAKLLGTFCKMLLDNSFARQVERWPENINARDAQGLAFHTLTVLISYKRCFESVQPLNQLVEVFLHGLSLQPSTQRCCLHALSLSSFELQASMTKNLPRIMEKLSQIMSNSTMAVHIIDFLAIVGSQRSLYVNFTENDYKMVFTIALKYLEQHNRNDGSSSMSWALSQHLRIMSYYIVYVWFLAVDMPDRHRHVSFIVRQLLLANGGKGDVDAPTEVAFDWLARYTYASADPRPAKSTLDEIVMNPNLQGKGSEPAISEKTWILGNSVVTIRALARRGWIEVLSRRASGLTKFLVRAENVPMVPLGDVDPDLVSISAMLMMDREDDGDDGAGDESTEEMNGNGNPSVDDVKDALSKTALSSPNTPRPDPITGYVWSRSAPSQRRKEVAVDPSYFALQLSAYPDKGPAGRGRLVKDKSKLASFFRTFDRMPVIDTHKVGVMYVAPGQEHETEILRNTHGSPAYTRFLEGLGRLIYLRGQVDVYDGGLDPDIDGEYAYAWWDDIGQILFHTATLMPTGEDPNCTSKKAHIGNDYVRIVWNDSGKPYKFDTLSTQFQFVNIVIEPHSRGAIAAFSNNLHEHEYFKVTVQRAPGMVEFTPVGDFKLISAANLPQLVRQISLLSDWFVTVWQSTERDTKREEIVTNWRSRLNAIQRFRDQMVAADPIPEPDDSLASQQRLRDFTTAY